jgi:hypothetical protein
MSPKWLSMVAFPLAFGLMTANAMASGPQHVRRHFAFGHHVVQPHVWWNRGWANWMHPGGGLVYAPTYGIIDRACGLPSSACPNNERNLD